MALPRQVTLQITYDGTVQQMVTNTVTSTSGDGSGSGGVSYTIKSGDTLWRLAKIYLGAGTKYPIIYEANKELIEETARKHGKANSGNGHWIWPGTVLTIPGTETEITTTSVSMQKVGISDPSLGMKISKEATSFSYVDIASGQSDSVSITMDDIDRNWIGANRPLRGASLGAKLVLTNWDSSNEGEKTFDCGTFVLDDISFSGSPLNCVLGGVSVPVMDDFKSLQRTQTWEKTTIENIASEIAGRAGVSLCYDADAVQIAEIEQSRQTDSAFLYELCEKYGLAMKVYNYKIVIFDFIKYEKKDVILTLKYGAESNGNVAGILSWSYNMTIEGTYTGVTLDYTDPDTDETINITMGSSGRMYSLNTQASSRYDAELQAAAKVNAANREIETMEITIRANISITASQCVEISGLESLDGKYFVDKIQHSIGNGYTMKLSLHKIQDPIVVTEPAESAAGGQSYTVVSGDTLWGISKRFYGAGTKYPIIYEANKELIEETARKHGKANSGNGHWIWPGEKLTIPEV